MEQPELLCLQPSEPIASESVEKDFFWFTCTQISEYCETPVKYFEMEVLEGHIMYYSFLIPFSFYYDLIIFDDPQ